jgi:ketosteroid isomerase-like protein
MSNPSHAAVTAYFELWNTGETAAAAEILAEDWVDHAHPEVTGVEGVVAAVGRIRAVRPDLHFRIDALYGGEDQVVALGQAGPARLVWEFRLRDGRLTELRTYQERSTA